MANIDFSDTGRAILENKELSNHLMHRLANITPEEDNKGQIEIELEDGHNLTFNIGPSTIDPNKEKKHRSRFFSNLNIFLPI